MAVPRATWCAWPRLPALGSLPQSQANPGSIYPASRLPFQKQSPGLPIKIPPRISHVQIVDLDGDSKPELLACDALAHRLISYRRGSNDTWTEHPISVPMAAPAHATVVDIDGDGDLDILVAILGNAFPDDSQVGRVLLLERNGDHYDRHVLLNGTRRIADIQAGDLDGDGDLDLAVGNTPVGEAGLETEPLFDEERILVVPSGHPLAGVETIDVTTLASYPVMLTPVGTTFRDAIDQELETVGVRLQAAAEVDGLRLLASLAYQGYAPALLPASAVSDYPAGEWSLVYVDGLARRSVGLVRNRRTTPSMPVMATKDVLCDVIRENGPRQPGIHVTLGT